MGWNFGAIMFNAHLEHLEETIIKSFAPEARISDKKVSLEEVISRAFRDIAIGYFGNKTILINPVIPYEFTSDLDFIEKPRSFAFLENLSRDFDILCVHLHSTTGIYGHCLFSKGERKIAVYKSGDEMTLSHQASVKKEEIKLIEEGSYDESFVVNIIEVFLDRSFSDWLKYEKMTFTIYKTLN